MGIIIIGIIGLFMGLLSSFISNLILDNDYEEINKDGTSTYDNNYIKASIFDKESENKRLKLSYQDIISGTLSSVVCILIYLNQGYSVDLFKYFMLIVLLMIISIVDIKSHYVYNIITNCGLILGLVFFMIQWLITKEFPVINILGMVLGVAIMYILYKLTKGFGEGDIEIASICGLFIGYQGVIFTIILGIAISGLVATVLLLSKKVNNKTEIAFGPYLSIGAIVFILYGDVIIKFYFYS